MSNAKFEIKCEYVDFDMDDLWQMLLFEFEKLVDLCS